ncbi:MAG: DUF1573 domain-containing protein, partial [Myxococcota bacterium]
LFVGDWMTPYTFSIHAERAAPYLVLPEDVFYMSVGKAELGASATYTVTARNEGTADLTLYDVWTTSPAFTVSPTEARIAPGDAAVFTLTYTATTTEEEHAIVNFQSDDPNQPLRKGYVVGNPVGIGVGDPFPYTEATNVETLAQWTSDDLGGQVTLLAYFATF